ncbi:MAG: peptidylprolyl isomerase [Bryobacterales bacterium]|nr:peptidylprolyl isomerase [Bryobacterales bacterium]
MRFSSLVMVSAALAFPALAEVKVIESIVAKVNGDIITLTDMERHREGMRRELEARKEMQAAERQQVFEERSKNILRDQIDRLLLVQKAREIGINVDPDVNRRVAEIQVQSKIDDPDKFQQWLSEQVQQPFEDFKSQMRDELLVQRVIRQEVGGRINIPRPEIEKYYEEHKEEFIRKEQVFLRDIFLSTQGKTPDEAAEIEKKANDLAARARKGERFDQLAREHSEAPSKENDGELGWWKRGELKKEIENLVFDAPRNFVSDPLRVENGFEIIKVEERHAEGQAALEDVEQEIMERLYMPRMEPRIREYLVKLREDAFLELREGWVDTSAVPGKDTSWKDPAQLQPETTTKAEVAERAPRRRVLWTVPLPKGRSAIERDPDEPPTVQDEK